MKTKTNLIALVCASVSVLGIGCSSKVSFTGGTPVTKSQSQQGIPSSCQPGTTMKTVPTKFLFVVDQSGSNASGPNQHPGDATDPQKAFRFGAINGFFQEHSSDSNLNWGFISFNNSDAQAFINSGDVQSPSFSGSSAMNSALQTFQGTADSGSTPYRSALQMAHDLIQKDIAANGQTYQYRIAFLTDGYPTDYCSDGTISCATAATQVASDVQSIVNLDPQGIQLDMVYYGLPDMSAMAFLKVMAQAGSGQAIDASQAKSINLDNVIQVPVTCN